MIKGAHAFVYVYVHLRLQNVCMSMGMHLWAFACVSQRHICVHCQFLTLHLSVSAFVYGWESFVLCVFAFVYVCFYV